MLPHSKKAGSYTEDPSEITNTFNKFFVNVATRIKEPDANSEHDKLRELEKVF